MSNSENNAGLALEVLDRIAVVAAAKNDAYLARALEVSPQTLSSWRKRKTVPFDAAIRFAAKRGLSLNYIFLGLRPVRLADAALDSGLFEDIVEELASKIKEESAPRTSRELFVHLCGILYNRIVGMAAPGINPYELVRGEVKYLLVLLATQGQRSVAEIYGKQESAVVANPASGKTTASSRGKRQRT